MRLSSFLTWSCATALLSCAPAHAGRPMVVDDAVITAAGECQVESWMQHVQTQTEFWAVPACNVGGSWELAAGIGRIGPRAGPSTLSGVLQAKTIFRPLTTNDWGIGLTLANQFREGEGVKGDLSALVPLTVSLLDDRVLVHANLGWLSRQSDRHGDHFWALGSEWAADPRLSLTLEAYGSGRGHAYAQAGLSYAAIPNRLALDAGVGERIGLRGAERYYTVGLTLNGPVRHLPIFR